MSPEEYAEVDQLRTKNAELEANSEIPQFHTGGVEGRTIDYEADAAYIQINLDLDEKGHAVGIELLTLETDKYE